MMDGISVVKRDGRIESFSIDKVKRVLLASGLSPDATEEALLEIISWADSQETDTITSSQIRDKVISELNERDQYAANMFTWYQKSKEGSSGNSA